MLRIKISMKGNSSRNFLFDEIYLRGIRKREKINNPFVPLFPLLSLSPIKCLECQNIPRAIISLLFLFSINKSRHSLFPFKARGAKKLLW